MSIEDSPAKPGADHEAGAALGFIAAGVVVLCWSGFNIVSRLGGRSVLTPFDLVSALLLSPLFVWSLRLPGLPWRRRIAIAGCAGIAYSLLAYTGFALAPAAHAGVLVNGGIPLATTLIGWLAFAQRPTGRAWLALGIASAGMALIGWHSLRSQDAAHTLLGDLCYLLAAMSWGLYGQLVRRWQVNPRAAAANIAACSAILYLPVYALWLPKAIDRAPLNQVLLQAGYQGVVAGVIAATCYTFATLRIGPTRASLMLALVPPISAVAAVPLLGEALSAATAAGALLVTIGAVLGATGGYGIRRRALLH